jgi:hypothetical protein
MGFVVAAMCRLHLVGPYQLSQAARVALAKVK